MDAEPYSNVSPEPAPEEPDAALAGVGFDNGAARLIPGFRRDALEAMTNR